MDSALLSEENFVGCFLNCTVRNSTDFSALFLEEVLIFGMIVIFYRFQFSKKCTHWNNKTTFIISIAIFILSDLVCRALSLYPGSTLPHSSLHLFCILKFRTGTAEPQFKRQIGQ